MFFLHIKIGNAKKGTYDKGYMEKGGKISVPRNFNASQKAYGYKKNKHICHRRGWGQVGAWKKNKERTSLNSDTEKDTVVTMKHKTGAQFLFLFSTE